jgi:hypothetical protein|nr:MAG TPA: hypothetical protein [Bacteriophage sp.]
MLVNLVLIVIEYLAMLHPKLNMLRKLFVIPILEKTIVAT